LGQPYPLDVGGPECPVWLGGEDSQGREPADLIPRGGGSLGEVGFRKPLHVRHGIHMRERPAVGEEAVHHVTVTMEMTARLFDREVHPVYATAWMVRHVEEAGRLLVERHLAPSEDATGYSIELTHERPASVGETLAVVATVTDVDERQCSVRFEV